MVNVFRSTINRNVMYEGQKKYSSENITTFVILTVSFLVTNLLKTASKSVIKTKPYLTFLLSEAEMKVFHMLCLCNIPNSKSRTRAT